ncbi:hypothetical protein ATANTOWER_021021 [Ataeniobius toweri]|uniref:Secreted protein n=1 Tax=Ataeniobius toweri TaxID=208326 RepID=A0ABU7BHU2_9TELE|nr:hypothetical protein [Ataeniobius toweri]
MSAVAWQILRCVLAGMHLDDCSWKPLVFGCMFMAVVLLNLHSSHVFSQDWPVCSSVPLYINTVQLPRPAKEKHPKSMMLPSPCFTVGMVFSGRWFSSTRSFLHVY